jgi:hypothetical protein
MSLSSSTTRSVLRAVRPYSPITPAQRTDMERMLRSISQTLRFGPKEAQRIADAFRPPLVTVGRAAACGFIEYGLWLQRLHERVPHGLWVQLFTGAGGRDGLLRPIPISVKQAQALVRIARHPLLGNPDMIDQLPPHWRTLDTLTRVPDPVLNDAFTRGRIHPRMQRAEAEALIPRGTPSARGAAARRRQDDQDDPFASLRAARETYDGDRDALVEWVRAWLRDLTGEEP